MILIDDLFPLEPAYARCSAEDPSPGDLVQIIGDTAPMYPDGGSWHVKTHIGYARRGAVCVLLGTDEIGVAPTTSIRFHKVLEPERGPVWVRAIWMRKL